ncbi:fibrinogen C domain-containing protein 1-like [Anopheles aquasalis]|uniref:fibrinogen C domain-containing protein 1-like n=1 Tax=Anopheles aquasalis TaxID=42839 RepID=UPI00215B3525|nr:fibrinogen C domain-containing protein 1-like [Anopheles aquasalis]
MQSFVTSFQSCHDIPRNDAGKYLLQPTPRCDPFLVYCEREKLGGGWIVVQHRFYNSLNFSRTWHDYRDGFGAVGHEYWIGLERLHQLTAAQPHELIIELKRRKYGKPYGETEFYARYAAFEIAGEEEQYRLKTLGAYSGTAGDSLEYHQGMKFSTIDRDNDEDPERHCAARHKGGWWFKKCLRSHLNGFVKQTTFKHPTIQWISSPEDWDSGLSYSRMMIRPLK